MDILVLIKIVIILDLNIVNFIRQRKNRTNLRGLLQWAAYQQAEITPIIGISEQHRTHQEPQIAFREFVEVLKQDFDYRVGNKNMEYLIDVFQKHKLSIKISNSAV